MFRNPRENRKLPGSSRVPPSTGRPPSPPYQSSRASTMPIKTATPKITPKGKATSSAPKKTQTTLVMKDWSAKSQTGNRSKSKPQAAANGNIMTFFKKAEEINSRIFMQERGSNPTIVLNGEEEEDAGWADEMPDSDAGQDLDEKRHESGGGYKKRKLSDTAITECSSSALEVDPAFSEEARSVPAPTHTRKRVGPFVDDSDSEDEAAALPRRGTISQLRDSITYSKPTEHSSPVDKPRPVPLLPDELDPHQDESENFDALEDDDLLEGEEYDERRWMKKQMALDKSGSTAPACPICSNSLEGLSEQESLVHVNACLDGTPLLLPITTRHDVTEDRAYPSEENTEAIEDSPQPAKKTKIPRPAQSDPFKATASKSAFSKLMAGNAEDSAWAIAAASHNAARGKPAYERTCPFYKILPGFSICVDAFRYGAVAGQSAYFLSHFHSDHYVGLSASWSHGPIYCSRVTANLVCQQLRVDPKYVVALEWESATPVPNTPGVVVTMIPANHCPGSSLFLFEKPGQRILHCGDFRACQAHIEHPLLRSDVVDAVSGKNREQRIDVCYLDTTYLAPKWAFPPQDQVIQAVADFCVRLNLAPETAQSASLGAFLTSPKSRVVSEAMSPPRLLIVIGTYSIGKERICTAIANALNSLIFAPPHKRRIIAALDDPELSALVTDNPRKAQVHMVPLSEIRADTLEQYRSGLGDHFDRAIAFRPSGWSYRAPGSRSPNPAIADVLEADAWRSGFSVKDLVAQRGATKTATCYGVPYSEHSSFRELTVFCCALRIGRIVPTVNVGSAKSREGMRGWVGKWEVERRKRGCWRGGF